jgi:hypothetical protein
MGFAGYVCLTEQTNKKEKAHTQGNNKNNEGKQHRKNTSGV